MSLLTIEIFPPHLVKVSRTLARTKKDLFFRKKQNISRTLLTPPLLLFMFSLSNSRAGPALPALARTPDDALGLAAEEIETLEPVSLSVFFAASLFFIFYWRIFYHLPPFLFSSSFSLSRSHIKKQPTDQRTIPNTSGRR